MAEFEADIARLTKLLGENNISLHFNESEKSLSLDKYIIYYSSKSSAIQTLEEVFVNAAYYFQTNKNDPMIVDAGSEVGMATIFFKIFYPQAKILCFEAHPLAFGLLQKNIEVNKLTDVTAVNAALANKKGAISFFGEFNVTDDIDTRAASIIKSWGLQRETSSMIQVEAAQLSEYVNSTVDYLKLNVEGAEQQIIEDLATNNKIDLVDKMLVKFHHSQNTQNENNLNYICDLLDKIGFVIKRKICKNPALIFPKVTKGWAADNEVLLYTLLFSKKKQKQEKCKLYDVFQLQKNILFLKAHLLEKDHFLLKNIINNIPASIYWKDRDGNYLGHSAYAIQQLRNTNIAPGATIKNIIGKSDYDLFAKDVADKYRKNDIQVMESKKGSILEENIVTPEGKDLIQLSAKKPLCDEEGEVIGIIGSTIDITEHKRAEILEGENKLQSVKIQEQEKFGAVASQVAHDIRSPLASLSMIIETCKNIPEPERISLREVAIGINDIANNLLSRYKKEEANVKIGKIEHVLMYLALNEVLSEKKYQYKNTPVKFNYFFDPNASFVFIQANFSDFKRMISNIINNAVDAFEGKDGEVDLQLNVVGGYAKVIIEDNGKGMPQGVIDKIMNNIAITNGKKDGNGIGFVQIRGALQSSQGKMSIESEIGKGTKITLTFPILSTPIWLAKQIELNQGDTVIILDDDSSIHGAWETRFKPYKKDIQLLHFKSGEKVIQFINEAPEKNKIFLLSDFELINQELDGLQIIKKLAMQQRSIVVTSHHSKQDMYFSAIRDGVKILPKLLASEVAIRIKKKGTSKKTMGNFKKVDLVIVDDNQLFADSLAQFLQSKSLIVDTYHHPQNFLENLSKYAKDTKICLDNDFHCKISGFDVAEQLYKTGYTKLYMLSGKDFAKEEIPSYLTVLSKGDMNAFNNILF